MHMLSIVVLYRDTCVDGVIWREHCAWIVLTRLHYRSHCGNDILQSEPFLQESNDFIMTTNGSAINVFISYAHEDEALLRQLETHLSPLKRQGLIATWYDRQIVAGSNWAGVIDAQLEQASIILLLVSADFLASNYCYEVEMTHALARHEAGQARVIPIALRPVDWKDAPFAHLQALPTDAQPITKWTDRDEAWTNVAAGIRRSIEDLSLLPASTTRAALPKIWNIPYARNSFFLGRDELLARLHTQLQAGQTTAISQPPPQTGQALAQSPQAISGLGGIGKTQLAVEYAYRYAHDYEAVLWARAATSEDLIASYSALATLLNLPEQQAGDQEITIEAVKRWLQTHQKWLLILDNADQLDLLPPFLPPIPGGHILLTTRAHDMRRLAMRLEVETLPSEQGALLLLRRAALLPPDGTLEQAPADEQRLASKLTEELGGLPLALDQAGAYLEATGTSLDEYLHIYQTHRHTLLNERRSLVEDHPAPVATTWSLSFEHVEKKNPAAADLLRLCAYLAPDAIPETILTKGAKHLGDLLAPVAADAFLFAQAIEALRAYSLLTRDPRARTLSVHRLVQAVLRDTLPIEAAQQWKQRAVLAVSAARPDVTDVTQWPACERWLPHALLCATWIEQEPISSPEAALLLNDAGYYLNERGRYREVEPLYQRGLAIYEQQLGPKHPHTATSLNNLALLYHTQGKYELAEPLYQRALAIREQLLGAEHPDTAQSLNNLAGLYRAQGNYELAEPLYQRAISIAEQTLGDEHPNTQAGRRNYVGLLRAMGREEEARRMEEEL
jgi:tetratricopeptide (TPR) repeat protein